MSGSDPRAPLDLPIRGWPLSSVRVADANYYLQLGFSGDGSPDYVVEVEDDVALLMRATQTPVRIRQRVGPYADLIGLLGTECVRAQAMSDGGLELAFADGSTINLAAPGPYETWQLRAEESEYLVVSVAGGGLAVFGEPPLAPSREA